MVQRVSVAPVSGLWCGSNAIVAGGHWGITWEPNDRLIRQITAAREDIEGRDRKNVERINEMERSINEILVGMRRPSRDSYGEPRR
jgi:hypothetical protein